MNKLILTAGMIGFALSIPQAQAGTPMMDDPLVLSVEGETSHCRENCVSAEIGNQQQAPPSRFRTWRYTYPSSTLHPERKLKSTR